MRPAPGRRRRLRQRPGAERTGEPDLDPAHGLPGPAPAAATRRNRRRPRSVVNRGRYPTRSRSRVVSSTRPADSSLTCPGENPPIRSGPHHPGQAVQAERRHRQRNPAGPVDGLRQRHGAVAGNVDRAREVAERQMFQHADGIGLVHQLQPGVPAEHHRHDRRQREIPGQRGDHGRPDDVREPGHGDPDVRPATAETADVGLDVDGVPGRAGRRHGPRRTLLGEDRRIAGRRAVDGGGGAHDQVAHALRALAGGQQLHGAKDVHLLGHAAGRRRRRRRRRRRMHDGVHPGRLDHPGDQRVADVDAGEIGARPSGPGRPARAAPRRPR